MEPTKAQEHAGKVDRMRMEIEVYFAIWALFFIGSFTKFHTIGQSINEVFWVAFVAISLLFFVEHIWYPVWIILNKRLKKSKEDSK